MEKGREGREIEQEEKHKRCNRRNACVDVH
jgi:hypothetical protein